MDSPRASRPRVCQPLGPYRDVPSPAPPNGATPRVPNGPCSPWSPISGRWAHAWTGIRDARRNILLGHWAPVGVAPDPKHDAARIADPRDQRSSRHRHQCVRRKKTKLNERRFGEREGESCFQMGNEDVVQAGQKAPREKERGQHRQGAATVRFRVDRRHLETCSIGIRRPTPYFRFRAHSSARASSASTSSRFPSA